MQSSGVEIRALFRTYWKYIQPYKWLLLGAFFCSAVASLLASVFAPLYYKKLFDALVTSPRASFLALFVILFTGSMLSFGGTLFSYVQNRLTMRMQLSLSRSALPEIFGTVLGQSYSFFADRMVGSITRQLNRFIDAFEDISDLIASNLLPMVISVTGVIIVLFRFDALVAFSVLVWAIVTIVLNYFFVKWRSPLLKRRAELDSVASGTMSDSLTNSSNVKLFNGLQYEIASFRQANDAYNDLRERTWRMHNAIDLVRDSLTILLEILVMGIALWRWYQGSLSIGSLVLFETYIFAIAGRVAYAGYMIRRMFESFSNAKEAADLIGIPNSVKDKRRAVALKVSRGKIDFEDVGFAYSETRNVLNHFSLSIAPREKVAFVGSSGAGKSTIVKLLFRLYDVTAGKILIDEQSIVDVKQESLRQAISLVPQDPILFHRSLRENIRYGKRNATDEEVIAAAKKARCHEFIMQTSEGYETLVGERGIKLSGGERQRIAIARAILADTPILALDEATSSLDSESEALIQEALRELMKDKTVMVIAHRLSTIMQMDRIIVMENGAVADMGTHGELLQKVGTYQKLWHIQAGGFQSA